MTRQILIALALVLMLDTAGAVRVLEQIERPVELTLADVAWPSAGGGTLSFSACRTCGISTHRLMATTVFLVNNQPLPMEEFLRVVEELRGRPTVMTVVFLDIASERVTRVEIRA
jgi:hypothetical protein